VEVELSKLTDTGGVFKASGNVNDAQALSARIELAYFNLSSRQPELAEIDRRLTGHNRQRWAVLTQGREVSLVTQ